MIKIIVAYTAKDRVIGKDGGIPWNVPGDGKHFKSLTENNVVLMGRKTFESIPSKYRPLPNRINIVLTTDKNGEGVWYVAKRDIHICHDLSEAFHYSDLHFPEKCVYIIGGGQVYKEVLEKNLVEEVISTEIFESYEGDTFFPRLGPGWTKEMIRTTDYFNIVSYKKDKVHEKIRSSNHMV